MHSQQTFNECIAQAEGALAGQGQPLKGWAPETRENSDSAHMYLFSN